MNNFISYFDFLVQSFIVVFCITFIAYIVEKIYNKKNNERQRILSTKKMAMIGLFSAISSVTMLFEIPMFFAPSFYKIDLSEVPVLVIGFAYGPVAAVLTELLKIAIKLVLKPTSTAFVGELANYIVGCSFVLPASILYYYHKTKKVALIGCIIGGICMTFLGTSLNAIYLLPKFAMMWGCDISMFVELGQKVNKHIVDVYTLVVFAVAPLNIIKSFIVSLIVLFQYKRISQILK